LANVKIKVSDFSKDLGIASKDLVEVLDKYLPKKRSANTALTEQELNVALDFYSQKYQVENFMFIFEKLIHLEEKEKKEKEEAEKRAEEIKKALEEAEKIEIEQKKSKTVSTRTSTADIDRLDIEKMDDLVTIDTEKEEQMLTNQKLVKREKRREEQRTQVVQKEVKKEKIKKTITAEIPSEITVGDLAEKLECSSSEIVKILMQIGIMASVSQVIDFDTAELVASELGHKIEPEIVLTEAEALFGDFEDPEEDLEPRAPVVVVMGHVDHGKTRLLDAIKNTDVISTEAGGITQHIGAYRVRVQGKKVTFLDTPGHEAFTAMRARGAQFTDIAILVVAADDGVMPQTIESINHAKAAGLSIIVAINKIDKAGANPDKVMQELTEYGLVPEEWGGDTIMVPISAKQNQNIDKLLEMVLLVAEMKELKANPKRWAKGVVIESHLDKAKGAIATLLVQDGTLKQGDTVIAGSVVGSVRAMSSSHGKAIKSAKPSVPVRIMGLPEAPVAGDIFYVMTDQKKANKIADMRKFNAKREAEKLRTSAITLDSLFKKGDELKDLNLIIKADVQGSVEAIWQNVEKLQNEEVQVKVIHGGVGGVTESDIMLASASNAIIIAFNVRPDKIAEESAERQGIEIRYYRVIYKLIEDIEDAMKGMLSPEFKEQNIGHMEVRQTYKVSAVGTIAGCYVTDGIAKRDAKVRVVRDGIVIHEGELGSLKRFKDDVKEVQSGYECGSSIDKFNDIKEGDIFELYEIVEIART